MECSFLHLPHQLACAPGSEVCRRAPPCLQGTGAAGRWTGNGGEVADRPTWSHHRSFGSGTPPGSADVPSLFVWRDEQSQAEVVVTWESGYGGIGKLFTLPNGVALAADWTGDNSGPNSNFGGLEQLRKANPGAHVHFSSFSAFFDEANKPENKRGLPVVTAEIGKFWPARRGLPTRHSLSFFCYFFTVLPSASPRGRKTRE